MEYHEGRNGPIVQWFKTSPLHGEDPEFEPRLDHKTFFFANSFVSIINMELYIHIIRNVALFAMGSVLLFTYAIILMSFRLFILSIKILSLPGHLLLCLS